VSNLLSLIPNDWQVFLSDYFVSRDWQQLCDAFDQEYQMRGQFIRPNKELLFNALKLTPVVEVKVILLGQDPYHSPGLAQGLAFSIPRDIALRSKQFPSSLRNINKALQIEGFGSLENGDLSHWAKQGVLLLNTALSVRLGEAGSHSQLGWASFVRAIIKKLSSSQKHLVWLLWGSHAQSFEEYICNANNHCILRASHPSGLGVYKTMQPFIFPGDQGSCGHFSKTNKHLTAHQQNTIKWVVGGVESEFVLRSPK
jgi:uracil-DNA glycosylase